MNGLKDNHFFSLNMKRYLAEQMATFSVSSSLSLCVFYWFNLCTLERPKCTIHVLSFLISIKKHFIKHTNKKKRCTALFSGVCFARLGCVFTLSRLVLRAAFKIFLYQLNLMYPVNDLWRLTSPVAFSTLSVPLTHPTSLFPSLFPLPPPSLPQPTSVCVRPSVCLSPALW